MNAWDQAPSWYAICWQESPTVNVDEQESPAVNVDEQELYMQEKLNPNAYIRRVTGYHSSRSNAALESM